MDELIVQLLQSGWGEQLIKLLSGSQDYSHEIAAIQALIEKALEAAKKSPVVGYGGFKDLSDEDLERLAKSVGDVATAFAQLFTIIAPQLAPAGEDLDVTPQEGQAIEQVAKMTGLEVDVKKSKKSLRRRGRRHGRK